MKKTEMRAVWLVIIVMVSLMLAVSAGVLSWLAGDSPARSILFGGGAFGGAMLLCLAIAYFLRGSGPV